MSTDPQFAHLSDVVRRPAFLKTWERTRHRQAHLFVQCVAEATGAFLYTFAGVGSTAGYVLGNIVAQPGVSSLFQIGFAYAMGILMAISICGPTSGGHFNPCVTIAFAVFKGFPLRKVPAYIIAQILGAYIALLLVYVQYKGLIIEVEGLLAAKDLLGAIQFTPEGPAGIFGLYAPAGSNLGYVLLNEFMADFVLGLVIWACIDPTNFFCPPVAAPFIIAMTYATIIWGYAPVGLAANSARDLGGRFMAMTIWGTAAAGGPYAAISALTNIPAMLLAALFYEVFFTDSARVIPGASMEFIRGMEAHEERKTATLGLPGSSHGSTDEK